MSFSTRRGVLVAATFVSFAACGSGHSLSGAAGSGGGLGGSSGLAGHGGAAAGAPGTVQLEIPGKLNTKMDVLFMIDNSSSMMFMQQKLAAQLPTFFQVLQQLPNGLPDLHVAVVSSDMGAPGDSTSGIGCTAQGDNGNFQYMPGAAATCTSTTLAQGATFISDGNGTMNFTDPIETVLQCISQIGSYGCGFEHQLASIDRALGSDSFSASGAPQPPAGNANFLRSDAYLGIVILTNEDDCSAPANTTIYSLNGGTSSLTNPDGPMLNYRCNGGPRGAHYCKDSSGNMIIPPLTPPASATGDPPILNLTDCQDNETTGTSALVPVSQYVSDIRKLKSDPDNQILVAAITAPAAPYSVEWVPPSSPPPGASGELWPEVLHSCGAKGGADVNPMATQNPTDGSFGDPGVRISQFVKAFPNSVLASICDANYRASMTAIATKLGALIKPPCVVGTLQRDLQGQPACTVTSHLGDSTGKVTDVKVQECAENGGTAPCWILGTDASACPTGGYALKLTEDAAAQSATSLSTTVTCSVCEPGSTKPGC
jgi:hypothetical protein